MVIVIRMHFLDASALVKLVVVEPGSAELGSYFHRDAAAFSTNSVCVAEALGVLKRKRQKSRLTDGQYFSACAELMAMFRGENLSIDNVGLSDRQVFEEVERLARGHSLDVSDAYQLITLRRGFFAKASHSGSTILISADEGLVKAARAEGIQVWDCLREPPPVELP